MSFSTSFPRLHSISVDQGNFVEEVVVWKALGGSWNLQWRRKRFEWERTQEKTLVGSIKSVVLNRDISDK